MKHQRDCHPSLTKETSTVRMNSVPDLPQFLQEQEPSKAYNRPASNAEVVKLFTFNYPQTLRHKLKTPA